MKKRIGILGGTFSPIHTAHIHIAKSALKQYNLDEIWFIVAGIPPHKKLEDDVSAFLRLKMCEIATANNKNFVVKDFECYDLTPSYSAKTLTQLKSCNLDCHFFFIMGEDSLDSFHTWINPEVITSCADLLVAARSDNLPDLYNKSKLLSKKYHCSCEIISCNYFPISSSELRKAIKNQDFEYASNFLPKNVLDFIQEHRIYEAIPEYNEKEIKSFLKKYQNEQRYEHCLRVADTAASLAAYYIYPIEPAYIAGLLHDCAKHLSEEELLNYCLDNNLAVTNSEMSAPYLLHGLVGADIAKKHYNIDDDMFNAISSHTRGHENMSLLEKIIFLADHIEFGRKRHNKLNPIRIMSYKNINKTIVMILEDTIEYLKIKKNPIDETTIKTLKYYKEY